MFLKWEKITISRTYGLWLTKKLLLTEERFFLSFLTLSISCHGYHESVGFLRQEPSQGSDGRVCGQLCHLRKVVVSSDTLQLVRLYDDDMEKIGGSS